MSLLFVEEALRILLLGNAGVSALAGDRLTNGRARQASREPSIVLRIKKQPNDTAPTSTPRGASGLAYYRVGVISYAKGAEGEEVIRSLVRRLDDAIRLAIDGYQGIVSDGNSPVRDVEIQGIFFDGTDDGYFDESQTHEFISVYDVWAEEQRPT